MITRRYAALSLIPLVMLVLGFAALGAPEPFRGPLVVAQPLNPQLTFGLLFLARPLYLADAIGIVLLALATLEIWVLAITWEYRRYRR
jgi:hypothetical protein